MGPAGNQPVHRPLRQLRRDLNRARLVDLPRAVAQVVEGVGSPALLCVDGEGERLGRILQLTTWAGAPPWDVTGVPSCCTVPAPARSFAWLQFWPAIRMDCTASAARSRRSRGRVRWGRIMSALQWVPALSW